MAHINYRNLIRLILLEWHMFWVLEPKKRRNKTVTHMEFLFEFLSFVHFVEIQKAKKNCIHSMVIHKSCDSKSRQPHMLNEIYYVINSRDILWIPYLPLLVATSFLFLFAMICSCKFSYFFFISLTTCVCVS